MNIVCATDDNFVQHCSIMLVSLLSNNSNVIIYILTEGLKPENRKIIEEEVVAKGGVVYFCTVDSAIIEKFPMPKGHGLMHISRATYYRLLMVDLLPSNLEKVIYLDCDIIINGSLDSLWNINLDKYAIAASKQIGYGHEALRLGYPIEYGYFNAGVNMVNLNYWRQNNVQSQMINYIRENYKKIVYHDQDTLNAVLFNRCYHILPQWNMTSFVYSLFLKSRGDRIDCTVVNHYEIEKENVKKFKHSPIVLHYVSKPKPWQNGCVHPIYHLYYDYATKTINFSNIKKQNHFRRKILIFMDQLKQIVSYIKQSLVHTGPTRL